MDSIPPVQEFSDLQRELFEVTGLYFDVATDADGVNLFMKDVHVFSLPLAALHDAGATVRQLEFPKHLKQGPTLVQRRAILKALSEQSIIRIQFHNVLASEGEAFSPELSHIQNLEKQARDEICMLIWTLNDVTIQRLAVSLNA